MPIAKKIKVLMTLKERALLIEIIDAVAIQIDINARNAEELSPDSVEMKEKSRMLSNLRRKVMRPEVI
jgi:hypothetical protein